MKILVVSPVLPYRNVGHGGGTILFHLIQSLVKHNEIALAAMYEPFEKEKLEEISALVRVPIAVAREEMSAKRLEAIGGYRAVIQKTDLWIRGFLNDAFSRPTNDVRAFSNAVCEHVRQTHYDLVQIEFPQWLSYLVRRIDAPAVVGAAHDVVFKTFERMRVQKKNAVHQALATIRYMLTKHNELATYKRLRCVYTLSESDEHLLRQADPTLNIQTRRAGFPITIESGVAKRETTMILFVGYLARGENQQGVRFMIEKVMPILWQSCPQAVFHIVGGGAPKQLMAFHNAQTIIFHGYQENLQAFYQRARVMVAPIFIGGGIITKIIEALMNALPTVSTTIGNEGIQAKPNEAILIADNPTDFANQIRRLIEDDDLHAHISQAARHHFEEYFHIERVTERLQESYRQILKQH